MSKRKSQVDRAIDALEEKKADVLSKANAEAAAIEHAIKTLRATARKPRTTKAAPDATHDA